MTTLEQILELLCQNAQFHISITDISGITSIDPFKLPPKYLTHSKNFCDMAKESPAGFRQCMKCKSVCNRMAIQKKLPFNGLCAFGMEEFVYPVIVSKSCVCILYVGNFISDTEKSLHKLRETCGRLNIPCHNLETELMRIKPSTSTDFCSTIAEIIRNYFRLHYDDSMKNSHDYHWAVKNAMDYVSLHYANPITLKLIAKTYFINEQYLGRIFAAQTGQTFHQYLTSHRLTHTLLLLCHTNMSITKISEATGFCTPSHFHQAFVKQYRLTPMEYRKRNVHKD